MPIETIIGAWVAVGLTLFIFTFLYKDNPLFKLGEHLYVGISVGYTIVKGYELVGRLIIDPIATQGEWSRLIPVAIGLLMLGRYIPKFTWVSRIAFAFVVGVGSGLAIPRLVSSYILKQIEDTTRPLVAAVANSNEFRPSFDLLDPSSSINAVIILFGVISVLFYFFFSVEHTGIGKVTARTGILFLMISFGAAFGYTAMARMSLLIGRFSDLIEYSSPEYGWATLWLLALTIGILVVNAYRKPPSLPQEKQPLT